MSTRTNIDDLVKPITFLAGRLRAALNCISKEELPISMQSFPRGACGDTSLLLGAYLIDKGFEGFEYVYGHRGSWSDKTWREHAWLAKESLVVDITADQFEDAPDAVIVSTSSFWHETFEQSKRREPADFRVYPVHHTHHLYGVYERIQS